MPDWNEIIFPGFFFSNRGDSMSTPKKNDVYQSPDLSMSPEQRVRALGDAITKDPDYSESSFPFCVCTYPEQYQLGSLRRLALRQNGSKIHQLTSLKMARIKYQSRTSDLWK